MVAVFVNSAEVMEIVTRGRSGARALRKPSNKDGRDTQIHQWAREEVCKLRRMAQEDLELADRYWAAIRTAKSRSVEMGAVRSHPKLTALHLSRMAMQRAAQLEAYANLIEERFL